MAIINEYVSQEDIKKYNLEKLVKKYDFYTYSPSLDSIDWTVDKERGIWLISCGLEHNPDIDHGTTRENIFTLHYKGVDIEVRVWLEEDSQTNIYISPFIVIWRFLSVDPSSFDGVDEKEIKEVLKEFLTVYGDSGIRAQKEAKNAIVKFRNF